jgi:hypothetical protein
LVLFAKYDYNDEGQEDDLAWACTTHGKYEECYSSLVVKPKGKRSLGRSWRRCVINNKMDLRDRMV